MDSMYYSYFLHCMHIVHTSNYIQYWTIFGITFTLKKYEGNSENVLSLEEYSIPKHTPFGTVYREDNPKGIDVVPYTISSRPLYMEDMITGPVL